MYHWPIGYDKPVSQLRSFSCKPRGDNAAPVMPYDNRPSLVVSSLRIYPVLGSNGNDKLSQALQNVCR